MRKLDSLALSAKLRPTMSAAAQTFSSEPSGPRNVLGVDIGGTKLAVGVATPEGKLLAQDRIPTSPDDGMQVVLGRLVTRHQQGRFDPALVPVGYGLGLVGVAMFGSTLIPCARASGLASPTRVPALARPARSTARVR